MKLYHYFSNTEYFRKVFTNCSLYFSSLSSFNDPYEKYTLIRDKNSKETFFDDECKNAVKAYCFSQTYSNYLLWSHYGRSHKGFCIEFDFPDNLFKSNGSSLQLLLDNRTIYGFPIEYKPFVIESDNCSGNIFNHEQTLNILSHKYHYWEYEKEYRFIVMNKDELLVKIPKEVITGVYYGFNINYKSFEEEECFILNNGFNIFHRKLNLGFDHNDLILKHGFINQK